MKYGFHEDGWAAGLKAAVGVLRKDVNDPDAFTSGKGANGYAKGSTPRRGVSAAPIGVLSAERSGAHDTFWIVCGLFFDAIELSGLRMVVGFVLGLWLSVLRRVAGVFIDLSDLNV